MAKKKFTDQAFLFAINSFKQERHKMIEDSLGQSSDLFECLYEYKNDALRRIEFERYELLALKHHWEDAMKQVEDLSEAEYFADLRLFIKAYRSYASKTNSTALGTAFIDIYLKAIDKLLETNRSWEVNEKKLRVEFLKGEKLFEDLIKTYQ